MSSSFTLAALDLIFPALCPVCQTMLGAGRRDPLCGLCWRAITRFGSPECDVCGAAPPTAPTFDAPHRVAHRREGAVGQRGTRSAEWDPRVPPAARRAAFGRVGDGADRVPLCPTAPSRRCATCTTDPPRYDYARSAAVYEGALREALHAFKFSGRRALAGPLGDLATEQCLASLPDGIEAVIPVPLARERERERGFNQAMLLARRIGRRLEVPTRPHWLARVRATRPQSDLSAADRRANVRGAFHASPRVAGRHVLVVDDILTTGATLDACARALRDAEARRVGVLTVARVVHAAV